MDRNTVIRWIVIAAAILVFWKWGLPLVTGKSSAKVQAIPDEIYANAPGFVPDLLDPLTGEQKSPWQPPEGELCTVRGNRFDAVLSTRGAAIKHLRLTEARYATSEAGDLSTTPDHERWRSLRMLFRTDSLTDQVKDQVKYDRFLWVLSRREDRLCEFSYQDDDVRILKKIAAGERPYELTVETTLTNLALEPRRHRTVIEVFAYHRNEDMKGSFGRQSPFVTELSCARAGDVTRMGSDDFKEGWFTQTGVDRYVSVSNQYFAQALVPFDLAAATPDCSILSEHWYAAGQGADDDLAGRVFHARMTYPKRELGPKESATYRQVAYFGPKERDLLAAAAGGKQGVGDLINLGTFTVVAKVLVGVLTWIHGHLTFGNWGIAIIVMTFGLRLCLFPLTWKSIQTTISMRRLKPEVDALNVKFADDAQAKNLAMMELWRKHKVNPFGGCLPMLVQMPVWFAMYTTLQTAVEMYHTKFLWFADLSAPDKYYVMPLVLGAAMIVQQRIVPQQGMDPMQQKMMTWMLPIIFTVMMLFLPAALGVYMLTNSVLGIAQQLAVEKFAPQVPRGGDIVVKEAKPTGEKRSAFGKGKARV
jgi:YidC/Oxa1 family membrane protein insertase